MDKKIIDFHKDELDDWVADLECGHAQHVRHNPPWANRPWVMKQEGRDRYLGEQLDCLKCNMPNIPGNAHCVKRSDLIDQAILISNYAGIQKNNSDYWIQVVVSQGELVYQKVSDEIKGFVIDQDFFAVIEPGGTFQLNSKGDVRFHLYYYQVSL